MSIDTVTLDCYVAVVEIGSFTKAAERIGRTQSAVSQQIAKLEHIVGKPLFLRDKKLRTTPDGEIFYRYAKQMLLLYREALDRLQAPGLQGEVRFGLPEDFASVFLSEVLAEFTKSHPLISLNIECDLTLNLFDRFKNHAFDLVLVKMTCPKSFPNGQNIWTEQLAWVGSEALVDHKQPIPLALAPQPCVYRANAIQALEQTKKSWRIAFSSPSYMSTIAAVRASIGITVLPRNMVPDDLNIIRNNVDLPTLADIHLSLLKHEEHNDAVNSFEQFVVQKLQ